MSEVTRLCKTVLMMKDGTIIDKGHPEELIKKHSNENDRILDCFLGSGTTAVASANLNRDFIGFELDEKIFEDACERLIPS